MADITHQKGPQLNQQVSFTWEKSGAETYLGRVTHAGLRETTVSFLTTSGPFTATFPNDWLHPSEASHEWTARATAAANDQAA